MGQMVETVTSFQRGIHLGGIPCCCVCCHGIVYEQTWHTHTNTHRSKHGQSAAAARGPTAALISIQQRFVKPGD